MFQPGSHWLGPGPEVECPTVDEVPALKAQGSGPEVSVCGPRHGWHTDKHEHGEFISVGFIVIIICWKLHMFCCISACRSASKTWPILVANWSAVAASMRYCPSRPTMFSETADVFGNDDDPLTWVFWTCATGWQEGGGGNGADRTEICPVEKASEDGKGGPRLLGNMARNHQNCQQRESKYWKYPCWSTRDPRDSQKTHLNRWESDQTELSLHS